MKTIEELANETIPYHGRIYSLRQSVPDYSSEPYRMIDAFEYIISNHKEWSIFHWEIGLSIKKRAVINACNKKILSHEWRT